MNRNFFLFTAYKMLFVKKCTVSEIFSSRVDKTDKKIKHTQGKRHILRLEIENKRQNEGRKKVDKKINGKAKI